MVLEVDVVVAEVAGVEVSSHLLCQVDLSSCQNPLEEVVAEEVVCEVVEVDTQVSTVPQSKLPRLRILPLTAGPLQLRKLLQDKMENKARNRPNRQLKPLPLEKETISPLLEDGETHPLQLRSRKLPSLETLAGKERESRQFRKSIQQLLRLLDHPS